MTPNTKKNEIRYLRSLVAKTDYSEHECKAILQTTSKLTGRTIPLEYQYEVTRTRYPKMTPSSSIYGYKKQRKYLRACFTPLENLPLLISYTTPIIKSIVKWRLEHGR